MAKRREADGDGLGRALLLSSLLLLVAVLLLRFHLVPAKQRLWQIRRSFEAMQTEYREVQATHQQLEAERKALLDDPMYQERLMRRTFRRGSSADDVYLKERR